MEMRVISLNEFMDLEFQFCFKCGSKKYCQFYANNAIYRVCNDCIKKQDIIDFFNGKNISTKCLGCNL